VVARICLTTFFWVVLSFWITTRPASAEEPQANNKPNVVLILADDLGYADLGCYGCKDIRTPHIDRLAREGVRLTDFYANGPVCTPTRAALITGRYQQRVGLEWALTHETKAAGLPVSDASLPQRLKANGYSTGMAGKWHLGYKSTFSPNAHGFDDFFGFLDGNVDYYSHKTRQGEPDLCENGKAVDRKGYLTDLITEHAISFIDGHTKQPFFLYVAYNATHWPFQTPDRPEDVRSKETWFRGKREDYAKMLERMDDGVGRILKALEKYKLAEKTFVLFTNDNGGERLSDNRPLFHHKGTLWEGGIRVPCILRWPDHLPAGTVSSQPAITMDLTASILAATGTSPSTKLPLDGRDLLPILCGKAPQEERTFFWRVQRADRKQQAVRKGKWKYVRDGYDVEMLFDLAHDPGERHDLAFQYPKTAADLRGRLVAWETELARAAPPISIR
jgi:arylsulfatase A-like enzyme